jgi:hypothetical protein
MTSGWSILDIDGSTRIDSVACISGLCVAGDSAGDVLTATGSFNLAASWTVRHVDGSNSINAVACGSTSSCVAGDSAGNAVVGSTPTSTAGWSVIAPDSGHAITGASCPVTTLCTLSDNAGDVVTATGSFGTVGSWTVRDVDGSKALSAVSCPNISLCIATDGSGDVVTTATPTTTSAWTVRDVDGSKALTDVGCEGPTFCAATDGSGDVVTATTPNSASWTTYDADSTTALGADSCSGPTNCWATDPSGDILWASSPSSTSWTSYPVDVAPATSTPLPAVSGGTVQPSTLSTTNGTFTSPASVTYTYQWEDCSTSGESCASISGATSSTYALTGSDVGHTLRAIVTAANGAGSTSETSAATATITLSAPTASLSTDINSTNTLTGISCPTTSFCVAVGQSAKSYAAVSPTGGASAWASASTVNNPTAVSCPTTSFCMVGEAGNIYVSSSIAGNVITWSQNNTLSAGNGSFNGADCTSATFCAHTFPGAAIASSATPGSSWATTSSLGGTSFDDLACAPTTTTTSGLCLAVGTSGTVAYDTDLAASIPTAVTIDGANTIETATCPSTSLCMVGDNAGNVLVSTSPTGTSAGWAATDIDGAKTIEALDCIPSTTICVAVDSTGDYLYSINDGATWSGAINIDSTHILEAVSCISASFCEAVDNDGNVINFGFPTVSGGAVSGQALTVSNGTFSGGAIASYSYQWYRGTSSSCSSSGTAISGATSSSYTTQAADVGDELCAVVTANNATASISETSAPTTAAVSGIPTASTPVPSISGTTTEFQALATSNGTFAGGSATSHSYQWHRGTASTCTSASEAISGAIYPTYTTQAADVGDELCAVVTSTNEAGSASETSGATAAIAIAAPTTVESTITDVNGTGSIPAVACPSTSLCVAASSSAKSYTSLTPLGGASTWASASTVNGVSAISCPTTSFCLVDESGSVYTASSFSADFLSWSQNQSLSGGSFEGAACTSTTFCAHTDNNNEIAYSSTPTSTWSVTSAVGITSLDNIACAPTTTTTSGLCVAVGTSGTIAYDTDLAANPLSVVTIDGANTIESASCPSTSLCLVGDNAGNVLVSINPTGAASSWTSTDIDGAKTIEAISCIPSTSVCVATDSTGDYLYSTDNGSTWSGAINIDASHALEAVSCLSTSFCEASDNDGDVVSFSLSPVMSGAAVESQSLSTTNGTFGGGTATYTYQWHRGTASTCTSASTSISGATSQSYSPQSSDVGDEVCAVVTATNASGSASETSASTPPIVSGAPTASTPVPSISGTTTELQTLSTTSGTWGGGAPASYAYQWHRGTASSCTASSEAISGAIYPTYTTQASDVGDELCTVVTATNEAGSASETSGGTTDIAIAAPTTVESTITNIGGGSALSGVACPTTSFCVAVAANDKSYASTNPLGGISAWVSASTVNAAVAIACPSTSFCQADDGAGDVVSTTPSGASLSWSQDQNISGTFSGEACSSSTFCAHTDGGNEIAYSATPTSTWSVSSPAVGSTTFDNLACAPTTTTTSGLCLAVGTNGSVAYDSDLATNTPTVVTIDGSNTIKAAACPSTSLCVVGDNDGNVFVSTAPTGSSASWTEVNIDGVKPIDAISCVSSASLCVAVDSSGDYIYSTDNGAAWSSPVDVDGTSSLTSVSCLSTSFCEAADGAGNVVSFGLSPIVTGSPVVTQSVSVSNGTFSGGTGTYTYQWYDGTPSSCNSSTWTAISGATSSSYTVASSDAGDELCAVVTSTNAAGSASEASAPTGIAVYSAPATSTPTPVVSGSTVELQTLSVTAGTFTNQPTAYAYQWYRGTGSSCSAASTAISGATASTYATQGVDVGNEICAVVTASNPAGSAQETSSATADITLAAPTASTPVPAISGTQAQAQVLTVSNGTFAGGAPSSYAYQWYRGTASACSGASTAISGATASTYTPQAADIGDELCALVTATNSSGSAQETSTPTSDIISAAPVASTPVPDLSGAVVVGQTLSASTGTFGGLPTTSYAYQWSDCANGGDSCTSIPGATSSTYVVQASDVSHAIDVVVTASNSHGSAQETSNLTSEANGASTVNGSGADGAVSISTSGVSESGGSDFSCAVALTSCSPSSTYTLARDVNASTFSVGTGVTLDTNGYIIYATTSVSISSGAVVEDDGANAAGLGETTCTPSSSCTQAGASGLPLSSFGGSASGGQGAGGTVAPSLCGTGDSCPQAGSEGPSAASGLGGAGGAGGTGYANGGAGGSITAPINAGGSPPSTISSLPYLAQDEGGAGGGGGATGSGASAGGGGGSGGGLVEVESPSITDSGTIDALGGNGGKGYGTSLDGGGGGGGGGVIYLIYNALSGSGTTSVAGGSGGAAHGNAGANGSVGQIGQIAIPAPSNTSVPVVSGTPAYSSTLSTNNGTWNSSPTSYSYQWQDCNPSGTSCANIPGATSSTYTLQASDVGDTVRSVVTATSLSGSGSASSAITSTVTGIAPSNTSSPALSGTYTEYQTLTVSAGSWSGVPTPTYSYQWYDGTGTGNPIPGATSSTYTLQASDVGQAIHAVVTATSAAGEGSASSNTSPAITLAAPTASASIPAISGQDIEYQTLSATHGTFTGGAVTSYSYQWYDGTGTGSPIPGATSSTYELQPSDVGQGLHVVVTATNSSGSATESSVQTATVATAIPVASAPVPAISGATAEYQTLSATHGTFTGGAVTSYSYQWQDCNASGEGCTSISGATGSSYGLGASDVGDTLDVVVTATNSSGSASETSVATAVVTVAAPAASTPTPEVSGTPTEYQALSATQGTFTGGAVASYSYRWYDGAGTSDPIAGATASTYALQASDVGQSVHVIVTATNASGFATEGSGLVGPVAVAAPTATGTPSISGSPVEDQALTTTNGSFGGGAATYAYQWSDCTTSLSSCLPISGATADSYTLMGSDVGSRVEVTVTATNASGSASETSGATSTVIVDAPIMSSPAPVISGPTADGSTLSATNGTWTGGAVSSYAYAWQRCDASQNNCLPISGATSSTYTLADGDVGHTIAVVVTASNAAGSANSTSQATSVIDAVPPTDTQAPSISGTAKDGHTLSASTGTWTGAPAPTYSYQWQDCSTSGESCADISGATEATYALADSDVGHTVVVVVTASNASYAGGGSAQADSTATASVLATSPSVISDPTVSGTDTLGQALTTTNGTWGGAPVPTFSYQWEDCTSGGSGCHAISGATSSSYTLEAGDVGHAIRVAVTASNSAYPGGGTVTAHSSPTGDVAGTSPVNTSSPTITGTEQDSQALVANAGSWSGATPIAYTYAWETCNASGTSCAPNGVTTSTYLLGHSDVGATLRVVVTASNADGSESATSGATGVVQALSPSVAISPAISGTAEDRLTLTTTDGTWNGTPPFSYSYQWYRGTPTSCSASGTPVGTDSASYTATFTDVADELCVAVTAEDSALPGGGAATATSASTAPVSGSTQILITNGTYAIATDNATHTVTVAPGTTAAELAGDIQPIDQTPQIYKVNSATPGSGILQTGNTLNVIATDPAEQDYDIIVAASSNCTYYPYGCTSGPNGYSPTYSETEITGSVVSGTLSLTPAAYESWTSQLSAVGDQVTSYSDPIDTNDNRGSGQGWQETITSTSYVGRSTAGTAPTAGPPPNGPGDSGDQGLSSGDNLASDGSPFAFGASGTSVDSTIDSTFLTDNTGSTDTPPSNDRPTPLEVPQGATAPTAIAFYDAGWGTGLGNFTITPSISVVVPANAYDGHYSSVVTLAVVSGP